MNAREKLIRLDEYQASEVLKMAELGYKVSKPKVHKKSDQSAYEALANMIGCAEAKAKIREVIASVRFKRVGNLRGHPTDAAHYHMVFKGPPGTAKTTIAGLYAQILFQEKITTNEKLVALSRASIIGRYQGETPQKVKDIFENYRGSCILIDEAYSLDDTTPWTSNTYGSEAIDELILYLEKLTDTVVIFAGYPEKMDQFLAMNPGLKSRVPITVNFPNYSKEELVAICCKLAGDRGFTIDSTAQLKMGSILSNAMKEEDFGNGRYCRNLVETAISEKALQLGFLNDDFDYSKFSVEAISDEEMYTLDADCFLEKAKTSLEAKHTIGF